MVTGILDSIIMFRFDKTKVEKTEFNIAKKKQTTATKMWDADVDKIN